MGMMDFGFWLVFSVVGGSVILLVSYTLVMGSILSWKEFQKGKCLICLPVAVGLVTILLGLILMSVGWLLGW